MYMLFVALKHYISPITYIQLWQIATHYHTLYVTIFLLLLAYKHGK